MHEAIADEFTRRLVERVGRMKLGTALDYGARHGLADLRRPSSRRCTEHVEDAVAKGARVLTGGRARPDLGPYFYEPTVLEGAARRHDAVPRRDVRAGRLPSRASRDEDDVVARANDSDYGLNFSVWTRDTGRGRALATRLHAGTVNVNEGYAAAWGSVDAPMGGMKASGLGRRHGAARDPEVHGGADRRRPAPAPDRAAADGAAEALGPDDDAGAAGVEAAAWGSLRRVADARSATQLLL